MDSQEIVVELLEENDWMTTLDISSAYQHVKVDEQFSPYLCFSFQSQCYAYVGMPFGAKDAPRIDLTEDSPVPEESGLDTVGGKTEVGTRKERGVSGMVVELRGDGSNAPRKEESAAPGGCANLDNTGKEEKETEDERPGSTPREAEFCEVTTPTSELVDETHATCAEAGDRPRWLEGNCDSQRNDSGRMITLEKETTRKQAKESEEKEQTGGTNDGRFRARMGCRECVSDKRKGVQSSVEDTRKKGSMAGTTKDRPYSSEDRQHVHEMDNTEEEGSAIAHSNTESIGEETEQPGHNNIDGTSPCRTEHGSRCTQPDGEKAGLCTEGLRWCPAEVLETILSEKEERERNTRRRHSASPSVPEKYWTGVKSEDEGSPEGTNDSDSASLAGADLDPVTAAWAYNKDPGDLSGVHDTRSEDEKGRLDVTPRRGDMRHTGEENIPGRDFFLTWGEYVGARDIAAAILRNQKGERDTWRSLRRFKQFLDRESMDDTDPLTTKDAKWIMAELAEKLSNTNLPAELERMRSDTTLFTDEFVQTQVQTQISGGEAVKVVINIHPNPRIDAIAVLQRWMDYTKTTFKDEHALYDIEGNRAANLQKIKEELTAILRENETPETFTACSIRHAVITHLARQEKADWKVINANARCAPGSRVAQEYYTVLPVQDTRWILETIGGSVLQRGEDSSQIRVEIRRKGCWRK
ncbi:uncharacterized protein MONOS_734 [Monocercomonoides exilis]|uniref:uncharacterized protein n=1 Tax=Monocercomonoides exilis TaxID=2049356 RepID=UPI0035598447|nr:hypothetical protein MONOS_734 [Monocercomonoides exilis]|eukprot:MONOS_734.1-p1 / transcript=MONOS_734.1 / gene=MONOS_734 / organism=Monocercomonoides_exilis_PA203 / gene_product=unspecified product / transcript_product=unspecified product / location=Mono_scaffold00012:153730-156322(-) / protein_length=696 / sequence_SO=supercontig / SO=protein_coding / is_pseudo=false